MAYAISEALAPDLKQNDEKDGKAMLSTSGSYISINIEAADVATLRATLNSYILLADASYRCLAL